MFVNLKGRKVLFEIYEYVKIILIYFLRFNIIFEKIIKFYFFKYLYLNYSEIWMIVCIEI